MIIQSKKVYYEEKLQPKQIEIVKDTITNVYPYGLFKVDVDYGNSIIMPGLVDLHNHGYGEGEANYATDEWIKKWTNYLPSEGVTSTLFTISSYPKDGLIKALKVAGKYFDKPCEGSHILGVYEEGPFICSTKERGAQNIKYQIIPNKKVIDEFNSACNGHLLYVMIAPEMLDGKYDVIDYCVSKGMKVAIGHTGATFDICKKAIEHGAISFTHTYNGMKGLHHREPGVVGAAMYYDECYAECICDGIHVNKIAANVLAKTKGKDKFIIVTDSLALKGRKDGIYDDGRGGKDIIRKGAAYCSDGVTLQGSCHTLCELLKFAIKDCNIDMVTAFNSVTINPLKMLGITDRGLIKEGYKADIAVFDDKFNNKVTYVDGKAYQNK